jgi:molybdenum-dependent DNA-binding transcriptional regulator ModE
MHDLRASINLQRPITPIALSDTIAVVDLRQLSALVAVDDHGSFSAAARALYTVQSNISAHIAHLERELGVTLVDRAKGRLTPEGMVVVARARRIQRELEALSADATSMARRSPARPPGVVDHRRWPSRSCSRCTPPTCG